MYLLTLLVSDEGLDFPYPILAQNPYVIRVFQKIRLSSVTPDADKKPVGCKVPALKYHTAQMDLMILYNIGGVTFKCDQFCDHETIFIKYKRIVSTSLWSQKLVNDGPRNGVPHLPSHDS